MIGRDCAYCAPALHASPAPMPPMLEVELKFQIPEHHRRAVQREMSAATARTISLQAKYLDTPDRRLARAGLALRLRQEGRRHVQTLKGPGDGMLARLEHEVPIGAREAAAGVNIARHQGTPVGERLMAALGDQAGALRPEFGTQVRRRRTVVSHGTSRIEIALDIGELVAGDARAPLFELEFELLEGPPDGLFALVHDWVGRHGLWLDVRSKAERGDRLARGQVAGPTPRHQPCALERRMNPDDALRAMVAASLAPLLALLADLAAGVGGVEHVHQARVGMRRLRALLREYGDWSTAVDPDWQDTLAALFRQLGAARDSDVLVGTILPQLLAAGSPPIELPATATTGAYLDDLRSPACTWLLLALIEFASARLAAAGPTPDAVALAVPPELPAPTEPLAARVAERLDRLHRRLKSDARAFAQLDDDARHQARKRLKRLRYCAEAAASLYRGKPQRRYAEALREAQEAIGRWCDLKLAEVAFHELARSDPRAWFGAGWLTAARDRQVEPAARALQGLASTQRFWRR